MQNPVCTFTVLRSCQPRDDGVGYLPILSPFVTCNFSSATFSTENVQIDFQKKKSCLPPDRVLALICCAPLHLLARVAAFLCVPFLPGPARASLRPRRSSRAFLVLRPPELVPHPFTYSSNSSSSSSEDDDDDIHEHVGWGMRLPDACGFLSDRWLHCKLAWSSVLVLVVVGVWMLIQSSKWAQIQYQLSDYLIQME